jgi:hypothetical protein
MTVTSFAEDFSKYQKLEDEYRRLLADYQAEVASYTKALEQDPNDPGLPERYERVSQKSQAAQETYEQLDELRRGLGPQTGRSIAY